MSGFTAVGSTTLSNIEAFPKSLLFWRSLTHWIGGIGILIFVMSFISVFGGTAVQLYSAEVTGISEQQFKPRISDITRSMSVTYLFLTLSGFLLLWAGPMDAFDAACHSFSAISTGGFSTKQAGIAHFNSAYVEYVLIVLMFLGATNFTLIFQLLRHFSPRIAKDEEFRWYASLIGIFTFVTIVYMYIKGYDDGSFEDTFRTALFQVVSSISTTAFTTVDFLEWGEFYWFLFLAMVLFCGCEGSTSGGMKISRLILLTKNARLSFKRFVHSQALYMVKINGQVVSNTVIEKALSFIFLYFAIIGVSSIALSLTGMSFNESFGTAISTLGNNGIGLGRFGPSGNFIHATTAAKYILCFLMLVGRLEIFTVLSLIVPSFWKK
jgi:trk system potassium uptake protein TrkH